MWLDKEENLVWSKEPGWWLNGSRGKLVTEHSDQFVKNFRWSGLKKNPPSQHSTIQRMVDLFKTTGTVHSDKKGKVGCKWTALTSFNCQWVETILTQQHNNNPGDVMTSSRRNNLGISKSSFCRLTSKIKWRPYRMRRLFKISQRNIVLRAQMGLFLQSKLIAWFDNLSISDEAKLVLDGHMFNIKNLTKGRHTWPSLLIIP